MDSNSFKNKIRQVYKEQFIDKIHNHLDKIYSLFKPKPSDWKVSEEGGHSENRHKYFAKDRADDIVNILSRSFNALSGEKRLKILDLGCGFGEFSAVFRGFGHDVLSINGGETWHLADFKYVAHDILELNYLEEDIFVLAKTWVSQFDYVFASEILTLDSLKNQTNRLLELLFSMAENVIVINHTGTPLVYREDRFSPEVYCSVADFINIITFYSDGNYERMANNLIASAKKFGYHIHSVPIKNWKSWGVAVAEKPRLIQKYYSKLGAPLLYLDADCEIIKPIGSLIKAIKSNDLCIRKRNLQDKYNLGVMGFGLDTKRIRTFLHEWTSLTKSSLGLSHTVDQKPFEGLLLSKYKDLKVKDIGPNYNFLPADSVEFNPEEAIILHHKASKTNDLARSWRNKLFHQER